MQDQGTSSSSTTPTTTTTTTNEKPKRKDPGYIKTAAHNYVSRLSHIYGSRHVEMKGKSIIFPHVYIRGDFSTVRIGRYCTIGPGTILRPPFSPSAAMISSSLSSMNSSNPATTTTTSTVESTSATSTSNAPNKSSSFFLPLMIGSHTRIGSNNIIEASSIGSSVILGNDCVIGQRVHIKDCCVIESGTVIPDEMVIPPFSIVRGCPARILLGSSSGSGSGSGSTSSGDDDDDDDDSNENNEIPTLSESCAVEFVDESVKLFEDFVEEERVRAGSVQ